MKRIFSIILIVGIAAIAVFGSFALSHASEHHGHVGCLSAAMPVAACPADIIAMFLFHAGILKSLLLSIVGNVSLVILSAFALCAVLVSVVYDRAGPMIATPFFLSLAYTPLFHSRAPIVQWLALHENSPSFA